MSEVHLKDNESLDSALKRFKRNCAKSGVLSDLRKKEYYQSPSVKRRKKSEAARKKKNKSIISTVRIRVPTKRGRNNMPTVFTMARVQKTESVFGSLLKKDSSNITPTIVATR